MKVEVYWLLVLILKIWLWMTLQNVSHSLAYILEEVKLIDHVLCFKWIILGNIKSATKITRIGSLIISITLETLVVSANNILKLEIFEKNRNFLTSKCKGETHATNILCRGLSLMVYEGE